MNPIFQALNSGYPADEILNFISKAIPQMGAGIKKAKSYGYPAQQILGFISKNFETEDRRGMSESERHAVNRRADAERAKYGLKAAATAFGAAVVTPLAASAARGALSRALPTNLANMLNPGTSQAGAGPAAASGIAQISPGAVGIAQPASAAMQGMPQQANLPQFSTQQPPVAPVNVAPNISQVAESVQPQGISGNLGDVLVKHTSKDQIDKLIASGNGPKEVAGFLEKFKPKEAKAIEKEAGQPLEKVVEEYLKANPQQQAAQKAEEVTAPEPAEEKPIEKGSTVATPAGVGEVKEIRNGKAIVEVDGKKHAVDENELIEPPIPEKDLADLYDDLISGIEKQTGKQVSRNVEWAGYDPNSNELAYKPHGSDKLYAYADISPEDVELLTGLLTQRKSTGQNFIGAWEAGTESPIGAAMYQLIKKLQAERGGKGNEYKNRYETIYDALEPAKQAAKKRHAERKKKAKKPRSH